MKYVIAFDIANNWRRRMVSKLCLAAGFRVQRSVFECFLAPEPLAALQTAIMKFINPERDTVRFYPLDKTSDDGVSILGLGKKVEEVHYKII
jgi:CRISPR-associated protein Cas2